MGTIVHLVDTSIQSDNSRFEQFSSKEYNDIIVKIGAACNGVDQALSDVVSITTPGSIDALIFYGHGAPGVQGVSMGKDGMGVDEGSAITVKMLASDEIKSRFSQLSSRFSSKGIIVLRGCNTAEGKDGEILIKKLSEISGVPVKASNWFQIVGRTDLSGNIITATPSGSITQDTKSGLKNLGSLPAGEGLLLLGVEFGDRMLKTFGLR